MVFIKLSHADFGKFCIFLIFAVNNNLAILKKKKKSHYFLITPAGILFSLS